MPDSEAGFITTIREMSTNCRGGVVSHAVLGGNQMRYSIYFALSAAAALLCGCQGASSPGAPATQLTAADDRNAKPATAEEEARFLAAGERQNRMAPAQVASSLDPTGLSQNAVQAAARPDMEEMQRLMPAMTARNRQRTTEFCAARPQMAECQEYARLMKEARQQGLAD
ncbi:hypothetical protein LRX75_20640 [Rhizobium sp. DKSPLA3]|uniref:Uncharacterized protein n=1 Tax=Rhizobium quercicola TaxID=2901226 RepID=A0A9X1T2D9_9HYPH|nr:hypothetical protein [Rhizobium quercicola]MCD7111447.1 hypothetical protein [Rhizobium quercicola]